MYHDAVDDFSYLYHDDDVVTSVTCIIMMRLMTSVNLYHDYKVVTCVCLMMMRLMRLPTYIKLKVDDDDLYYLYHNE